MTFHPRTHRLRLPGGQLGVVKGVLLALALFAVAAAPAAASQPAPNKQAAKFEIDFMQGMIDHHHMAVMMAELCLESGKATHAQLRTLCQNIIASQTDEIEDMQSWLTGWYGITYEPRMMGGGMMKQLERASGADFEIRFMEQMIRHHRMAVMDAQKCLDRAYHPELKQLCQNIIRTQTAEIRHMQTWLCEWYGRCDGHSGGMGSGGMGSGQAGSRRAV